MAASVLNSPKAVEMSVEVVRAFVRLRGFLAAHHQLAAKLDKLERISQPTTANRGPVRGSPQPDGDSAERLRHRFRVPGQEAGPPLIATPIPADRTMGYDAARHGPKPRRLHLQMGRLGRGRTGQQGHVLSRAVRRAGRGDAEPGDGRRREGHLRLRARGAGSPTRAGRPRSGASTCTSRGASSWRPSRRRAKAPASWARPSGGRRPGTS